MFKKGHSLYKRFKNSIICLLKQSVNGYRHVIYGAQGGSSGILNIPVIQQICTSKLDSCMLLLKPIVNLRIERIKSAHISIYQGALP